MKNSKNSKNYLFGAVVSGLLALTSTAQAANTEVTVLLAASDTVQTAAGGADGLKALMNSRIKFCNDGFTRSKVSVTYKLVGSMIINNAENGRKGLAQMFPYFTELASVVKKRNEVKADLVGGLFNNLEKNGRSGGWGSGYMITAYNYENIFMHEFGHNFGCGHHPDRDTTSGRFSYSAAHAFKTSKGANAATIMGSGIGIDPVSPVFSSPNVTYSGGTTGTAERDNVKTIGKGAATVAAYK